MQLLPFVHFDEMIDREDGERDPHRRRRGRADLEHGQRDNSDGEYDLQIDIVIGRALDFVIDLFHEIDDDARRAVLGRELAMVIANPRAELNPVIPVGRQISNVAYYHLSMSRAETDRLALNMLRAVRIPDPERRFSAYPHELSGGMAQRVAIAMALICSPKLVISDDATSGLDVTVQAQVLDLLQRMVGEKGAAALFITRDIAITAHCCSRIAIIYAGEIVELAETAAFFLRPAHPYSIMLLAAFSHSPALRARWTRLPGDGETAIAGGCAFAPRCVRRQKRCVIEAPTLRYLAGGRCVRCHFPVETAVA